ncbi:MAG: efflux RND transporter periplasmic adaptor subunit [Thermodesulfobacteriota bacterium]
MRRDASSAPPESIRTSRIPGVVFCLVFLLLVAACKKKEPPGGGGAMQMPPAEVTALRIVPRDVPLVLDYLGQTEASRVIEVRTRVEGVLEKIEFVEGNKVEAGAVLFRLETTPFETALENTRAQLAQQQAVLDNARRIVARLRPLVAEKAVSQKDLDDALAAETTAAAAVRGAQARVKEAEINLGYTTIRAPIAGITGRTQKNEGALVSPGPGGVLTTVSQLDPMFVNFNISETEMIRFTGEAQNKTIVFPEGGNFDVELKFADGSVYPHRGRLNFSNPFFNRETGTLGVRAKVANPTGEMLPGLYLRVHLHGAKRPNAILVPQRAVLQGQNGKFVFVVAESSLAEMRNVEVGEWVGQDWLITAGLKPGETVVVDGAVKIQNGMPVKATMMGEAAASQGPPPAAGR